MIEQLNNQYQIPGHVRFESGQGGLAKALIDNEHAQGEIYLHGAHVTSFQPHGRTALLWMSGCTSFADSLPIRGGIPICWPWFSQHPTDSTLPQHGFARTTAWQVEATRREPTGATTIQLGMANSDETYRLWPHAFRLSLTATFGEQLTVTLRCCNVGDQEFTMAAALHSYLLVSHISNVRIEGLAGRAFIDQLDDHRQHIQSGSLVIQREIDRIYVGTEDDVLVHDSEAEHVIHVTKEGSDSTVIWNPWIAKSRRMTDFPDNGYETMVCVETTNAADDERCILPGAEHVVSQTIGCRAG